MQCNYQVPFLQSTIDYNIINNNIRSTIDFQFACLNCRDERKVWFDRIKVWNRLLTGANTYIQRLCMKPVTVMAKFLPHRA